MYCINLNKTTLFLDSFLFLIRGYIVILVTIYSSYSIFVGCCCSRHLHLHVTHIMYTQCQTISTLRKPHLLMPYNQLDAHCVASRNKMISCVNHVKNVVTFIKLGSLFVLIKMYVKTL